MDSIQSFHLERLKAATINKLSMENIPEWLCKNTFLNGQSYNFHDHEYQEKILRDTSPEIVIRKCAQVGMSETSARLALALVGMIPHYTVIYTLPTATFASVFMNTRVNPIIQSSPFLSDAVSSDTDNASVKRLGDSYLYLKGAASSNAAISVPANCIISDESCFSDQTILSQYYSRLRHAKDPKMIDLSTPTAPGWAIDEKFTASRRYFNFCKCQHCNHLFIPDYYKHVRIPGFNKDLKFITAANLFEFPWKQAYLECPSCGREPSLQPAHREWVCENPTESHSAVGYQVSPFDAPNIMTVPRLVQESTKYLKQTDFMNFGLGLPAEDEESTLLASELDAMIVANPGLGACSYVMGMDMGLTCHAVIIGCTSDGMRFIAHTERIPVGEVRVRRRELQKRWRLRMTVVDSLPYTETVLSFQNECRNLYGSVYVNSKSLETHRVVEKDEDAKTAQLTVRQVNINRSVALDLLMDEIKGGELLKVSDENDAIWKEQMRDMKRVKEYSNETGELSYVWKKSTAGNDHFHHATLYASTASKILGASRGTMPIPMTTRKFKVKTDV